MIIWLASYPKSGNTWDRLFLNSLIFAPDKNIKDDIEASFKNEMKDLGYL